MIKKIPLKDCFLTADRLYAVDRIKQYLFRFRLWIRFARLIGLKRQDTKAMFPVGSLVREGLDRLFKCPQINEQNTLFALKNLGNDVGWKSSQGATIAECIEDESILEWAFSSWMVYPSNEEMTYRVKKNSL